MPMSIHVMPVRINQMPMTIIPRPGIPMMRINIPAAVVMPVIMPVMTTFVITAPAFAVTIAIRVMMMIVPRLRTRRNHQTRDRHRHRNKKCFHMCTQLDDPPRDSFDQLRSPSSNFTFAPPSAQRDNLRLPRDLHSPLPESKKPHGFFDGPIPAGSEYSPTTVAPSITSTR